MRRCFSSLGCAEFSLDEVLALARAHGIAAVELRALGGTLDLPAWFAAHYGTPAGLVARLETEPVRVVALDTSLRLVGSTGEEWEKTLGTFLPWAEALGGVRLRVFDGGGPGIAGEVARMAERLDWWQGRRRERGWRSEVMVETHDRLFTAAAVQELLAAAPGTKILWDSHHTWKRGGEDPVATWQALAPHIGHIHVKDSVSRPSAQLPYRYVLPGTGEFPAAALRSRLSAEYAGELSLEWEKLWHPDLPELARALASAGQRDWW